MLQRDISPAAAIFAGIHGRLQLAANGDRQRVQCHGDLGALRQQSKLGRRELASTGAAGRWVHGGMLLACWLLLATRRHFCGVHACVQRVKRRVRDVCVSVHACVQEV